MFALEQLGNAAGVVDDFDAAAEFAHRVVEHLAVLFGQQGNDLVGVFLEHLFEAEHDLGAFDRRRVAPGRERGLGSGDRILDGCFRRHGDMAHDVARRRVRDGQRTIVVGDVLAVDEMADDVCSVDILCGCGVHVAS